MSKKIRKKKKKVVSLPATTYPTHETIWCGFRINKVNHNRLWRWDTLEDV
jgi:hypothetical protein